MIISYARPNQLYKYNVRILITSIHDDADRKSLENTEY
jgi:hypothetical protein